MTKAEKKELLTAIEFTYGNNRAKVLKLRKVINLINKPVQTTKEQPKICKNCNINPVHIKHDLCEACGHYF